jgi:hypothetical protein
MAASPVPRTAFDERCELVAAARLMPLGNAVTVVLAAVAVLLFQIAPGIAGLGVGTGPPVVYARRFRIYAQRSVCFNQTLADRHASKYAFS